MCYFITNIITNFDDVINKPKTARQTNESALPNASVHLVTQP